MCKKQKSNIFQKTSPTEQACNATFISDPATCWIIYDSIGVHWPSKTSKLPLMSHIIIYKQEEDYKEPALNRCVHNWNFHNECIYDLAYTKQQSTWQMSFLIISETVPSHLSCPHVREQNDTCSSKATVTWSQYCLHLWTVKHHNYIIVICRVQDI